jgi:hypothetical protein
LSLTVSITPQFIGIIILLVAFQLGQLPVYGQINADSPSFVRQEIKDAKGDWELWKGSLNSFNITTHNGDRLSVDMAKNLSDCKINGKFISPDIESISYMSDGKILEGTIWLTGPFRDPPANDTVDVFQEQMNIDIKNENYSLADYLAIKKLEIGSLDLAVKNFTLSGLPAQEAIYNETYGSNKLDKLYIWTVNNNKVYDITFSALDSKFKHYYPIAESMINSFIINALTSGNYTANHSINNMRTYHDSDIGIDYPFGWQILQSHSSEGRSVTLLSPFEDSQTLEPSWHESTFTMAIDLSSVYDAGTDYRVVYSRIPYGAWTGNWTRLVEEVSAYDKLGYMGIPTNTGLYDSRTPYRIPFSFDLEAANSPQQYNLVFYITDHYLLHHHLCRLVDTTNWVIVPPPKFLMTASPSSAILRPGTESNIVVEIKGNSNLQSEAALSIDNPRKDLSTSFIPTRTSIPSSSSGASTLHIKLFDNTTVDTPTPVILPIKANISFPNTIINRGGDTFSNNKSITLPQSSNFTLTLMPHYTTNEQLNSFVNSWITPVSGMWTFLAGVGAVIVPVILHFYRKRRREQTNTNTPNKRINNDSES